MLDQFDEHRIEIEQIEHAHVAVVRVEHRHERVDASPTAFLCRGDQPFAHVTNGRGIEHAFYDAEPFIAQLLRGHVTDPSTACPDDAARQ